MIFSQKKTCTSLQISDCFQIRIWNTVSTKMETLVCELLKKELYITYSRGSRPTPNACTLCVHIKHADDPEKNSIYTIGYCSVQSPHIKLLCYFWTGQDQTEKLIHDINIKILQFFYFLD